MPTGAVALEFDDARFVGNEDFVLHGVRSNWARRPSSFQRESDSASGLAFADAEFFVESPAWNRAAAIVAASEFTIAAFAAEFAVTEVAVAGLASGFAAGTNEDATFLVTGVVPGVVPGFAAVDFVA